MYKNKRKEPVDSQVDMLNIEIDLWMKNKGYVR